MAVEVGQAFPEVSGQTHDGKPWKLSDFRGKKNVVLYFYPRDLTPGCTREAIDFDRLLDGFAEANTEVVGMSVDPADSHQKFSIACGLHFPLLSDANGALSRQLGIFKDSGIASRTTYLIDKAGNVNRIWSVSQVDGHASDVLESARALA